MTDPRLDRPPGSWASALAALARVVFPLPATPPHEVRRVLVVRTDDRVGNALLSIPLVRALQKALPSAQVDLLLAAKRARVADGLPNLRVIPFEKTDAFRHPLRFAAFLRRLRAERYDAVVDAAHWHAFSATSALLSRLAAHRWLVGAERGPARIYSAAIPPPACGTRELEAKLSLGDGLGLRLDDAPMETALGRGPPVVRPPYAALNPGARKADHRWSGFAAVARELFARRGLRSVVLWGPGEEPLAREVVEASQGAATLAPPTDLDQLAAAFRHAAVVITNDTGPLHLATACGAPTVAVLLREDGLRWVHPSVAAVVAPEGPAAVAAAAIALLDSRGTAAEPAPA